MFLTPWSGLENQILKSQQDADMMNAIIAKHQGFIHKCIQEYRQETGDFSDEDQVTVGMMAFKEAVENYDRSKGKFIAFAAMVIRRRLIDQYRRERRQTDHIQGSFDEKLTHEGERENTLYEIKASLAVHQQSEYRSSLVMEIEAYREALKRYDLDFSELVENAPKSDELKALYMDLARYIHENLALRKKTAELGRLPMQELEHLSGINRKKIERGRKYILAVFVLMSGDFEMLSQYIKGR